MGNADKSGLYCEVKDMKIIYRVVITIGFYERWFDFTLPKDAVGFAQDALQHHVPDNDNPKPASVKIELMPVEDE